MAAEETGNSPSSNGADAQAPARPSSHSLAHDRQLRQRVLRIRISDAESGRVKVNLTLPVGLVGVAGRLGARLLPREHNRPELISAIEHGELHDPVVFDD